MNWLDLARIGEDCPHATESSFTVAVRAKWERVAAHVTRSPLSASGTAEMRSTTEPLYIASPGDTIGMGESVADTIDEQGEVAKGGHNAPSADLDSAASPSLPPWPKCWSIPPNCTFAYDRVYDMREAESWRDAALARIAALERDHESRCDQVDKLQQRLDEIRVAVGGYFADDLVAHIRVRMTELGKLTREKSTLERDLADLREYSADRCRKWSNAKDKIASLEERLRKNTESKPERQVVGDEPVEGAGSNAQAMPASSISSALGRPADALLPCPFCGGKPILHENAGGLFFVECGGQPGTAECGVSGLENSCAGAIAAWNRRSQLPAGQDAALESENARLTRDLAEANMAIAMRWPSGESRSPAGETKTSEGAAIREDAGRAETDTTLRIATPSDASPAAWTEEQRRSATAVAATVAFWKERADDREIAQTCDEIAKHAYLFVQDPKEGERSAMREVRPETSASSEPLGSALSDDEIGSQIMNGLGGEKYDPSDLMPWERRVGKRARALFAKPAPVAVTRERIMTIIRRARHLAMETSPGDVNYSEERVADAVLSALSAPVSAEDFKKACEAYRDARDDVATSLRAALASIGIATEGT